MSLGAIGAFLMVLVIVFVVGNIWFHFVEAVLDRIKRWCRGPEDSTAWHPLPPEQEDDHKP